MKKAELTEFLKRNLRVEARRRDGYVGHGGPQDGESTPGDIEIELWLGDNRLSSVMVEGE